MIYSRAGNRNRPIAWLVAGSLSLALTVACTVYTPVLGSEPASGYDVRVLLSDRGSVELASRIGPRARQVEGTLQQITDSSLVMSVRRIKREGGVDDNYGDLQLSLTRQDIETVEKSRMSIPRSLITAGAIVASAFLVARGAGDASGGKTGGPPPPTR